jgi:uncharacterized membrane protein YfcA
MKDRMVTENGTAEARSRILLLLGIPLGVLCGLLGLSGTEYRVSILRRFFHYPTERTVPFNLTISVMTLAAGLVGREPSTSAALMWPHLPELLSLLGGSLVGLYAGAAYADRRPTDRFERFTLVGLVAIGVTLIVAMLHPFHAQLPLALSVRVPVGVALGTIIGAVSSIRGISGGQLLIPALVLAFGADIKVAGSASACVSFPIVLVGLVRHARTNTFVREREYHDLVVPLGVGSALGAVTGGYLVSRVPAMVLGLILGALMIVSSVRALRERVEKASPSRD